ncbi:hypothetical protein IWW46_004134 [Coemansia sp. RSA 2440]|nr:hypothetical protein IWW46_004134 [Coemansia sp. RSA 2440]
MPFKRISIGAEPLQTVDDADAFVAGDMVREGADFAILPIIRCNEEKVMNWGHFEPEDLVIKSADNSYCLLGATSSWDSDYEYTETVAGIQAEYAGYTGLKGVVTSAIGSKVPAFGRLLYSILAKESSPKVYVRVCLSDENAWQKWNRVRVMCNHSPQLQVLLELDPSTEKAVDMKQWMAEPVHIVVLPESMFTKNAGGYPVLPRQHQATVAAWMDYDIAFVIQTTDAGSGLGDRIRYLRHLGQSQPERSVQNSASDEYRDILQVPLQPLMDHLESATYETFEQDEPKYAHYEEAMVRAIGDVAARIKRRIVLMVVGAGRGPLVSRALRAARRLEADVHVIALEKNPNAMVELQRKNATLWLNKVEVIYGDMRNKQFVEKADILVSELLGSFGDNELSPECLDGALKNLATSDCVCIPRRYTAYVAPLSSSMLFRRARKHTGNFKLETPYVVNIHAAHILDDAQPVWKFRHGRPVVPTPNERTSSTVFTARSESIVHGLAGFFDAELYPGVELSICPATHTPDMHSWFPMYFPIQVI